MIEEVIEMYQQEFRDIELMALLNETHKMKIEGWRLAQICAVPDKESDGFILLYSFTKDLKLVNLRARVERGGDVESIGWLYEYAFLYENELKDLFGINVIEMALDFHGNLYKTSVAAPFGLPAKHETEKEEAKTDDE